ncbi:HD domain-containing protein [Tranquillimonas alkanivorans]|uniref:Metal dependent phosphohydrolase n=1 Tax=Tranquillimonas alkanivorans TaxID=441119 RepID=A0A1I5R708_9RHOB|nr:HD domain-containing protein [Tranquillimonas alkanivorans]SFP54255.1 metal dependent phosphohydrolase [Tranquillimonas alkanivorans]
MLNRLTLAYLMAARAHADQARKGDAGIPYINHPCEVAHLVAETGADEDLVIAAVLHDVIEDSDTTRDDLEHTFGPRVADLVAGMTNPPEWDDLPRSGMKARQAEHMKDVAGDVKRIKIADQTSNLHDIAREPTAWDAAVAAEYIGGARLVVDACRGADPSLESGFDRAVARAERAMATGEPS